MSIYDLTNGALLRKLELDIHTRYALPSESFFDKDRGSLQVRYGMPIRSAHWVKDRVFLHVEDERNQENQLLVALDAKGRIDQIDHLPMDTSRVLKDRDQLFSFHADTSTLKILELEYL